MADKLTRILYVEDEVDIQVVARTALEKLGGFTVEVCSSGSEALEKITAFRPQIILLDVMMPGMDGPATLSKLRELRDYAAIPVIFMTARVQPEEMASYKQLGAVDVIPKPFKPRTLVRTVQDIWERCHGESAPVADIGELHADLVILSDEYAKQLLEQLKQLDQMWTELRQDAWDEAAFETLHRMVHGLAGSGKTFGFALLSDMARNLDDYLKQLAEVKAVLSEGQRKQIQFLLSKLNAAAKHRDVSEIAGLNCSQ
jgi:CheY-like chemotaxis protein